MNLSFHAEKSMGCPNILKLIINIITVYNSSSTFSIQPDHTADGCEILHHQKDGVLYIMGCLPSINWWIGFRWPIHIITCNGPVFIRPSLRFLEFMQSLGSHTCWGEEVGLPPVSQSSCGRKVFPKDRYIYICIYICIYVCIYVYVYICICIYICIYIYMCIISIYIYNPNYGSTNWKNMFCTLGIRFLDMLISKDSYWWAVLSSSLWENLSIISDSEKVRSLGNPNLTSPETQGFDDLSPPPRLQTGNWETVG